MGISNFNPCLHHASQCLIISEDDSYANLKGIEHLRPSDIFPVADPKYVTFGNPAHPSYYSHFTQSTSNAFNSDKSLENNNHCHTVSLNPLAVPFVPCSDNTNIFSPHSNDNEILSRSIEIAPEVPNSNSLSSSSDSSQDISFHFSLNCRVKIQPGQGIVLPISFPKFQDFPNILVLPHFKVKGLIIEPGLYSNVNGQFLVQGYNLCASVLSLQKGTCLGLAESISNNQLDNDLVDDNTPLTCHVTSLNDQQRVDRDLLFQKELNSTDFPEYEHNIKSLLKSLMKLLHLLVIHLVKLH